MQPQLRKISSGFIIFVHCLTLTTCAKGEAPVEKAKYTQGTPLASVRLACGLFPPETIAEKSGVPLSDLVQSNHVEQFTDEGGNFPLDRLGLSCTISRLSGEVKFETALSDQLYIISVDRLDDGTVPPNSFDREGYLKVVRNPGRVALPAELGRGSFVEDVGVYVVYKCTGGKQDSYAQIQYFAGFERRGLNEISPILKIIYSEFKKAGCR